MFECIQPILFRLILIKTGVEWSKTILLLKAESQKHSQVENKF